MGAEKDAVLPKRVGGSRVHLLLGIKNTNLDPVLIKVLPSGIAVYLSPFKDIYGSRMIFAGPHKSFTKNDDGVRMKMSNAVFFVRDQIHEGLDEMSERRCFPITTDKRFGITVNPYPINEEDILDCDGEISEQFEESLDDHEKLLSLLEDSYSLCNVHNARYNVSRFREVSRTTVWNQSVPDGNESLQNTMESNNLRGVHKAHVLSKFRNALDDEDREDQMGFRCAECAKCLTCKTSSKKTAISLREAREQQFIEESVVVDTKSMRVLVNYPFLKDPVEYLSEVHKNPNNYGQAVKVYKTQCRKSDAVKEGMRKVHADLIEKGFMVR